MKGEIFGDINSLISIIVPVYNAERYLNVCIQSIVSQNYTNIEIILVNDGSTDKSADICDDYARRDKRVKVYHIKNGGAAHARNYGIKKAQGKYLMFVDSDDYIDCSYTEKLYTLVKDSNVDLGIVSYYEFYDSGEEVKHKLNFETANSLSENIFIDYCVLGERLFYPYIKIYKMDIVKDNNIFFPEDMVTAEDQAFNYMYLAHVKKYKYLDECLYAYRKGNSESLSSIADDKSYYSEVKNLKLKRKFFDDFDVRYKESMLLWHYIWMVEKYKEIENDCLAYVFYDDDSGISFKDKIKKFMLKHHALTAIMVMAKLKKYMSI